MKKTEYFKIKRLVCQFFNSNLDTFLHLKNYYRSILFDELDFKGSGALLLLFHNIIQ
jgi:hypothetical protein